MRKNWNKIWELDANRLIPAKRLYLLFLEEIRLDLFCMYSRMPPNFVAKIIVSLTYQSFLLMKEDYFVWIKNKLEESLKKITSFSDGLFFDDRDLDIWSKLRRLLIFMDFRFIVCLLKLFMHQNWNWLKKESLKNGRVSLKDILARMKWIWHIYFNLLLPILPKKICSIISGLIY